MNKFVRNSLAAVAALALAVPAMAHDGSHRPVEVDVTQQGWYTGNGNIDWGNAPVYETITLPANATVTAAPLSDGGHQVSWTGFKVRYIDVYYGWGHKGGFVQTIDVGKATSWKLPPEALRFNFRIWKDTEHFAHISCVDDGKSQARLSSIVTMCDYRDAWGVPRGAFAIND